MRVENISNRLYDIETLHRTDPEKAHVLEDLLYRDLLEDFAKNADPVVRNKAREALRTQELNFPRWSA